MLLILILGLGVAACWTLEDWPPPALILRHGLPGSGGPTGATRDLDGLEFVELEPGYFSSEINPDYIFNTCDSCYLVGLTVTDAAGCESSFADSICVFAPLQGDFTAGRVCLGDSTLFVAGIIPSDNPVVAYTWDFGDGSSMTTTVGSTAHVYPQAGTYYAGLILLGENGCEKHIMHAVTVDAPPVAGFVAGDALCEEATLFTDMSEAGAGAALESWWWDFGDPLSGAPTTPRCSTPHTSIQPPTAPTL